jgi:8-oxo-dGTP pyrophosphatase MutT (NUDIX family)
MDVLTGNTEFMKKSENETILPKAASTVILAREQDGALKVYLLRRSSKSKFMPGRYVFPGGVVEREDEDTEFWKTRTDLAIHEISQLLGGDIPTKRALAHGVAAIRETFEEAGVFPGRKDARSHEIHDKICDLRSAGSLPKGWLREWFAEEEKSLPVSQLRRWSHWITPVNSPIRFDTRFFVSLLAAGQECVPDSKETTRGIWISPEEGLEGNDLGTIPLSPPTLVTLHELLPFSNAQQLHNTLENREWGDVRIPRQIISDRESLLLLPWDPEHIGDGAVEFQRHTLSFLPAGAPFSRLFLSDGIWRPVEVSK